MLGLATWGLIRFEHPAIWIAAGARAGLHGLQLHRAAARGRASRGVRRVRTRARSELLGMAVRGAQRDFGVAVHALASRPSRRARLLASDDPKRHHLSPKINARWFKLLYMTPALFPIYFRAARRESATYAPDAPAADSTRAAVTIGVHLIVLGGDLVDLGRRPPRCAPMSCPSSSCSRSPSR